MSVLTEGLSKLKNVVLGVAPILANAIIPGSGTVISMISNAIGSTSNDPSVLADQISAMSDNGVKLKELETNCKVQLQQIASTQAVSELNAYVSDMASARNMRSATQSKMPDIISIVILIGFISLVSFMCYGAVPIDNKDILNILVGATTGAVTQVVSFWLGSSKSSNVKDSLLFNSTPTIIK